MPTAEEQSIDVQNAGGPCQVYHSELQGPEKVQVLYDTKTI